MENIHDEKLIDVHFNEIFPEEKYKLVSNFLKEYITHYKMSVEDLKKRGVYARARKSKTITQLLYLVDKMIEDNTYPIIDNFREMLLKYKIYEQDHLEYMTLLLYPEDYFNNNKKLEDVLTLIGNDSYVTGISCEEERYMTCFRDIDK